MDPDKTKKMSNKVVPANKIKFKAVLITLIANIQGPRKALDAWRQMFDVLISQGG